MKSEDEKGAVSFVTFQLAYNATRSEMQPELSSLFFQTHSGQRDPSTGLLRGSDKLRQAQTAHSDLTPTINQTPACQVIACWRREAG
jgi:hypothetical protein